MRTFGLGVAFLILGTAGATAQPAPPAATAPGAPPPSSIFDPPPDSRPANPSSPATHPSTVDLLALVDPAKDAVAGKWSLDTTGGARALVNRRGEFCRLQLPYQPPEEYDFRVVYTDTSGGGPVILLCPVSNGSIMWFNEYDKSAFESQGKKVVRAGEPFIKPGGHYTSMVKVRKDKIQGYLDGRLMCEFDRTTQAAPAISNGWRLRDPAALGLAVWGSDITFSKVEVVEVSGAGKPESTPAAAARPPVAPTAVTRPGVDAFNDNGRTALMQAAWDGNVGEIRRLLASHPDLNLRSKTDHKTALICAAREGHLEAVRLLVEAGADINLGDPKHTALWFARFKKHKDVVDYLVSEGAAE